MNIYKRNKYKYGVLIFDDYERYMRFIYGPAEYSVDMHGLYRMVDTEITEDYKIFAKRDHGFELRFRREAEATWFQLAKGRFVKG